MIFDAKKVLLLQEILRKNRFCTKYSNKIRMGDFSPRLRIIGIICRSGVKKVSLTNLTPPQFYIFDFLILQPQYQ